MQPAVADSAGAAWEILEASEEIPLILTDVHMPEMSGFDLIARLRNHFPAKTITIVMLTSGSVPGDAARCRELGVDAYLTKPVRHSELLRTILLALKAYPAHPRGAPRIGHSVLAMNRALNNDDLPQSVSAEPMRRDAGKHALATLPSMRILLAEDNQVNQILATRLLAKYGHTVVIANDGAQALTALERESFDLVLMDVQMPEMDGLETSAAIRAREQGTGYHIPIVAMTAHAMSGDRERCIASGMDDYVTKPIRLEEVSAAIYRVIKTTELSSDCPGRSQ